MLLKKERIMKKGKNHKKRKESFIKKEKKYFLNWNYITKGENNFIK